MNIRTTEKINLPRADWGRTKRVQSGQRRLRKNRGERFERGWSEGGRTL